MLSKPRQTVVNWNVGTCCISSQTISWSSSALPTLTDSNSLGCQSGVSSSPTLIIHHRTCKCHSWGWAACTFLICSLPTLRFVLSYREKSKKLAEQAAAIACLRTLGLPEGKWNEEANHLVNKRKRQDQEHLNNGEHGNDLVAEAACKKTHFLPGTSNPSVS